MEGFKAGLIFCEGVFLCTSGEDSLLRVDKAIQVTFCTLHGQSHPLIPAVHIGPSQDRTGCGEPFENRITLTV